MGPERDESRPSGGSGGGGSGSSGTGTEGREPATTTRVNPFVVTVPTVEIYFQRSPGVPHGGARGISGLKYRAYSGSRSLIQQGTTGADGKIDLRVPGGSSTLELLHNGTVYATYEVTVSRDALLAVTGVEGQKERLRLLGYQIGHAGTHGDGVDGSNNRDFERSVLDFQVDKGRLPNANVDANVRTALTTDAGG